MPGKHKGHPTIAFRPSAWEKALIDERALLSGHYKKDFIARSCIYSNIVVTGTPENIGRIIDELQIMESVLIEIATQMKRGNFPLCEDSFEDMRMEFLALVITALEIMRGAAYLYHIEPRPDNVDWKKYIEEMLAT